MAPTLPSSLSPHVCVLSSPDLEQLLRASSLPPLEDILQSFSPLPQVTTRTTALVTVPHSSFALRFSSLVDVEDACKEDEEQRATRTIDWIGERINQRCAKWTEDMEKKPGRDSARSPWWDELRCCSEGDNVPCKMEGWNHPVSIILAVSTMAPNPLQAITTLHSRTLEFPSWVDTTHLVYTLIVHSQDSSLSDEEAGALFNAVKKQYGPHTYLLPLSLPSPPPPPVLIPPLPPRLPPSTLDEDQNDHQGSTTTVPSLLDTPPNTLRMSEQDIQKLARFTREFVVMSLVPWMEKCVVEWNEVYSSSRRLPSRLFSSTRRLFGSGAATPQTFVHGSSTSVSSLPTRSHSYNASQNSLSGSGISLPPPSQQRRLAEFATILGDYKLAIGVWESLRKEGKGGSDILPILLSASPAVPSHVTQALSSIHSSSTELPPQAQLQALKISVRWETSIEPNDFLSDTLEGERWLVWAAGNAEEAPSALLLAHAALLSVRKQTRRRAALWYFFAATKLQKCGIKPLAMYFLRRAHEILGSKPEKLLSPSFWESEEDVTSPRMGFEAAISGIEHPLGRLLYTTGDTWGAIKLFLGLLRWSSAPSSMANREVAGQQESFDSDKVYLEDFAAALTHLKSIANKEAYPSDMVLPVKFAIPAASRLQLRRDPVGGEESEWERREEVWRAFWKPRGKEPLEKGGKAVVGENFWVEVTLHNPLDTEVTLADLVLTVEAKGHDDDWTTKNILIERVPDISLFAKESRVVSFAVRAFESTTLTITYLKYNFLNLLPTQESLARRGRRLQETLQQRLSATYAPDILLKVDVEDSNVELDVSFEMDDPLMVLEGEYKRVKAWITNAGSKAIDEVWVLVGREDQIVFDSVVENISHGPSLFHTDNKFPEWTPYSVACHAVCAFIEFIQTGGSIFHCTRVMKNYDIKPCLITSASSHTMPFKSCPFRVDVEISNLSSTSLRVTQVITVSPIWRCQLLNSLSVDALHPAQSAKFSLAACPSGDEGCITETLAFVSRALGDVLHRRSTEPDNPPPLDLICNRMSSNESIIPSLDPVVWHLYLTERRNIVADVIERSYPHIPSSSYPNVFPFYNPLTIDVLVFWEIPSDYRSGFTLLPPIILGATHGTLREIIEEVEQVKVTRNMYAETQREKMEILHAIRDGEWNTETNPLAVTVEDSLVVEHDFSKGQLSRLTRDGQGPFLIRSRGPLTIRVQARFWVTRPGMYALSGWKVEVEVGEPLLDRSESFWRSRYNYVQSPPANYCPFFTVNPLKDTRLC
ncbi:ER-golgi trafficking TRAPP I complex 85 kDa subunit-domain-containing protein [Scleroderma citrinum]